MINCEIVYKIEFDGVITREEFQSLEKAMEAAQMYFVKNQDIKEAKFFKCTKTFVNITMVNKHYGDKI